MTDEKTPHECGCGGQAVLLTVGGNIPLCQRCNDEVEQCLRDMGVGMDSRCTIKIEFTIYNKKYNRDFCINYYPPDGEHMIDDRVRSFFEDSHRDATGYDPDFSPPENAPPLSTLSDKGECDGNRMHNSDRQNDERKQYATHPRDA